jgi:uncharacterized protein YjbI with pentapeptide repeats
VPTRRTTRPRPAVDWDAVADVRLAALTPATTGRIEPDERYDGVGFEDVAFGDVAADDAEFLDCRLAGCSVDEGRMRRSRFSTCVLEDVRAAALDVADSVWDAVAVRRSRVGALVAHGAGLEKVTFDHVRLDYVNLREARLDQVQFVDCGIEELDLGTATLTTVRFTGCRIGRLVVAGARLTDVDLRGAELDALVGVDSLAGARIDEAQLARLAPALAAHLGIAVGAPDTED